MKLLFLIGSLQGGGAERQLRYLVQALVAEGDQVTVALLERESLSAELTGVQLVWLRANSGWYGALSRFRRLAETQDLIYSMMDVANVFAAIALAGLKQPQVWGLRSAGYASGRLGPPAARIGSWLSRSVDLALCNSAAAKRFYASIGYRPRNWGVVKNAVDCEVFSPAQASVSKLSVDAAGSSSAALTVGMVGRADVIKRHDVFLAIAEELHESFPNTNWLIAGGGTDAEDGVVKRYLQQSRLGATVEVCGAVSDMPAFFRRCDLLVCCSDYEGSSNAILEALACAVPVVAYPVGDAVQLLEGCGLVVAQGDTGALSKAVAALLLDPNQRQQLGTRARAKVRQQHSVAALARDTRALLLGLLEDRRQGA